MNACTVWVITGHIVELGWHSDWRWTHEMFIDIHTLYSNFNVFKVFAIHLPGPCIYVVQSADGSCKAQSYCPFINCGTRSRMSLPWPWSIPIVWSSPRLPFLMASPRVHCCTHRELSEPAIPVVYSVLKNPWQLPYSFSGSLSHSFWDVQCASSLRLSWTRGNKQGTYGFIAGVGVSWTIPLVALVGHDENRCQL